MPAITVVVCTRDRGLKVLDTVSSVLASDTADLECLVIDQSQDTIVADEIAQRQPDPRLRYVKSATRGLSRARNMGLRLARSPIVAMTDDDCIVDSVWTPEILRAFAGNPRIGLVFGNVVPASFDPLKGFIPSYVRKNPFMAVGQRRKLEVEGMGACMAVNRETTLELGGFDERLGAGSELEAGEDVDLTLRMLESGYAVFETPDIKVTHHRFESWTNGPAVVRSYWRGAGAALGKYARRKPLPGCVLLSRLAFRFAFKRSRVARSLGSRGMAMARLTAFMSGLRAGVSLNAKPMTVPLRESQLNERDGKS